MKDKIRKYILDEEPYTGIAVMIIGLTFLLFITGLYFYASVVDCDEDYAADKDKYGEITAALLRDLKKCPETEYVEETADMFITENALYDNRLILRCRLCGGEEFCIGAGTEITEDGLYVNPRVIPGSDFEKHTYGIYAEYGVYLQTARIYCETH